MKKRSFGWSKTFGSAGLVCLCLYGCVAEPVDGDDQTQVPPQTGGGAGVGASSPGRDCACVPSSLMAASSQTR